MLLVVLAACLGVSAASICDDLTGVPDYENENVTVTVDDGRTNLQERVKAFLEGDAVFKKANRTLDLVLGYDSCKNIFDQGYCYYHVGKARYADIEEPEDLTFNDMKEGVDDATFMANHLCHNLAKCWQDAQQALLADLPFLETMEEVMKDPLQQIESFLDSLSAEFPEYESTIQNIRDFMEKHNAQEISEENADEDWGLMDTYQAFENITEAMDMFSEWCSVCPEENSACVEETSEAVTEFLEHLHGKDEDEDQGLCRPAAYCEHCQGKTTAYFESNETKGVPCCLRRVINKGIEKYESWQEEDSYDEAYNIFKDALDTFLEEEDKELLETQAECYKESYNLNEDYYKDLTDCPEEEEKEECPEPVVEEEEEEQEEEEEEAA